MFSNKSGINHELCLDNHARMCTPTHPPFSFGTTDGRPVANPWRGGHKSVPTVGRVELTPCGPCLGHTRESSPGAGSKRQRTGRGREAFRRLAPTWPRALVTHPPSPIMQTNVKHPGCRPPRQSCKHVHTSRQTQGKPGKMKTQTAFTKPTAGTHRRGLTWVTRPQSGLERRVPPGE